MQRYCRVEQMQFRFPGSMSFISRNSIDAAPGCGPVCTFCIIPDHAGRGEQRWIDMFHRVSSASLSLAWYSSINSSWYLSFARPVHGPGVWLIWTCPTARISSFVTLTLGIFLEHCLTGGDCTQHSYPMESIQTIKCTHIVVNVVCYTQICEARYITSRNQCSITFESLNLVVWSTTSILIESINQISSGKMIMDLNSKLQL